MESGSREILIIAVFVGVSIPLMNEHPRRSEFTIHCKASMKDAGNPRTTGEISDRGSVVTRVCGRHPTGFV